MTEPLRKIQFVEARKGYRVAVTLEQGPAFTVDLSEMVSAGGVFATLADQARFAAVRVGENNRLIEWPEPKDDLGYPVVEIDADALYRKALVQRTNSLADLGRAALEDLGRSMVGPLVKRPRQRPIRPSAEGAR